VPTPARRTPLKLLPKIAEKVPARAAQLNLSVSGYIAILLWNQKQAPAVLAVEPDSPRMIRVNVGISWRKGLRVLTQQVAKDAGLSANALAEALIARDLRSGQTSLTILPRMR